MHYYNFNIGDYVKSTQHLSIYEDLAYRRLLDRYYDTEKPLEADVKKLCRFVRLTSYEKETQAVLDEFFSLTKNGWIQKRVKKELDSYSRKADAARANGKKGGRPKKTQSVNLANPELTQPKAKQEPINNKQETINNNQSNKEKAVRFVPPTIEDCCNYFASKNSTNFEAQRFFNHYEANGWKVGKNKMKKWPAAASGWISRQSNFSGNEPKKTQGTLDDLDNYAENLLL